MINTFIHKAIPNDNGTFKQEAGELITRVNMPYVFTDKDCIMHDNAKWHLLFRYFDIDQDAFIIVVYKS